MNLEEHLGELARWSLAARVRAILLGHIAFFLIGICIFGFSALLLRQNRSEISLYLGGFPSLLAAGSGVCLLLFLIGHLVQRHRPENRAYGTLALVVLLGFDTVIFIEMGLFSSLTWLSIMGVAAILFALFEKTVAWLSLLLMLGVFTAYSALVAAGELPYRDLLSALTGNAVSVSGIWLVMHWITTGPIAIAGIWLLGALLGGWHKRERRFESASVTDPLTKAFNRRRFMDQLLRLCESERADEQPFAVAIFDLDYFKKINDTHGHATGDLVLQVVADVLRETLRDGDLVARFGGEEFAALLPRCNAESAFFIAERCRQAIESKKIPTKAKGIAQISTSVGVSIATSNTVSAEEILEEADRALYQAKETGRNRTVLSISRHK